MNRKAPVVIIGAGRSGTNMLRDILVRLPGYATWPCDEINYIWRHGNRSAPTDQFTREMASPSVMRYIRRQFDLLAKKTEAETVVEKTCANSLRCGFVDEIVPEARFIHIVRDGRDVAYSATQRWKAKLDLGYIFKKARYVPKSDFAYYGTKYLTNRISRLFSQDGRLSVWGPRFEGMKQVFENESIAVACAIQWKECVVSAARELEQLDASRVYNVQYEQFTSDPIKSIREICHFLGTSIDRVDLGNVVGRVSQSSVGMGSKKLGSEDADRIQQYVGETLSRFGYAVDDRASQNDGY